MYVPLYMDALMEQNCFVKYITDYKIYAAWVVSKNRYGKHGRRKAN